MNKLKHSKTSVGDLEYLDAELRFSGQDTPPTVRSKRTRPKRGFSVSKVLTTATAKHKKTPQEEEWLRGPGRRGYGISAVFGGRAVQELQEWFKVLRL
jgi:hypothetical protein